MHGKFYFVEDGDPLNEKNRFHSFFILYPFSMDDQQESTSSYLPGAASLIEQLDKRIMIILRDGKHLVGKLRSFDHFMNLILEETFERLMHSGKYCDVPLGLYVVRGDSIVLLGELDAEQEDASSQLQKLQPRDFVTLSAAEPDSNSKVEWDFESW